MVMSSQQNSESISGVQSWVYAVAAATQPEQSSNQRLLRPRLASTSLNPRLRKRSLVEEGSKGLRIPRKRTKVMADQPTQLHEEGARGRGRGRGRPRGQGLMRGQNSTRGQGLRGGLNWPQGQGSLDQQVPMLPPPEDFAQFIPSTLPSRSRSPSKRGNTIDKPRSDASINMAFLQTCNPSVCLRDPIDVREHAPLPALVQNLYNALVVDVPSGFIPVVLKPQYEAQADTPRKSQDAPSTHQYLPTSSNTFPAERMASLKKTVDLVVKMAKWNYRHDAHERQWGATTVNPLLNELLMFGHAQSLMLLNVEQCSIDPIEFQMKRPNNKDLVDNDAQNMTASATDNGAPTTSRMIDLQLGLLLDECDMDILHRAFGTMNDNEHSVNQSISYIRTVPAIVDFELKKTTTNRLPEVQLAIWHAGLYSKRKHHKWDTSMPMPGVTVNGFDWVFYITFERDGKLIMMGPSRLGSTRTINGTYEILYKLDILARWGTKTYRAWFQDSVLGWFRNRIDQCENL